MVTAIIKEIEQELDSLTELPKTYFNNRPLSTVEIALLIHGYLPHITEENCSAVEYKHGLREMSHPAVGDYLGWDVEMGIVRMLVSRATMALPLDAVVLNLSYNAQETINGKGVIERCPEVACVAVLADGAVGAYYSCQAHLHFGCVWFPDHGPRGIGERYPQSSQGIVEGLSQAGSQIGANGNPAYHFLPGLVMLGMNAYRRAEAR
ncbi:hypothetical protein J4460_04880 [Candidatus Woesearchaeota archaeon]|nr:hypothetical protein [Candidatus Woesearchaeota archaeon]HIH37390.1 hypothetical protein [Candidatus Woesearchaeota archaeon]HIH48389.1 hypothetical protein [Candidatus Woesearchaeota archaeon]HIJ04230.1 hypothetical protein [Candidatus Woesearchaeota archaeon]